MIRCGDTVLHKPTGAQWLVAYADYDRNIMSPCGWPESMAKVSDCDLIRACPDSEHLELVRLWLAKLPSHSSDHRPRAVERLYGKEIDGEAPKE